jgi:hypothetical protein
MPRTLSRPWRQAAWCLVPFVIHGLTGSAAGQILAAPPTIDLPAPFDADPARQHLRLVSHE